MASLTTFFKSETTDTQETDKLVDLFRNRVELKKEFAALRNEKYKLQDQIKQHQGATARVQQQFQHLENLLLDPDWVNTVVVFYQLRGLAAYCKDKLSSFAEQIKQQREQRVHSKVLVSWNEQRKQKTQHLESRIGEHRMTMQLMEDRLQAERHKRLTMNGFVKLFRGRSLAAQIDELATQIETAQCQEQELLQELDAVHRLAAPDHKGLDISAKRSVNFMILSFAQNLYLQFEEDDLVELAKEASEKSVGAINYGAKPECDVLLKCLEKRKTAAEAETDIAEVLQKRAKLIAEHAEFRHDDDAVPVPSTVSTIFSIDGNGAIDRQDVNLLGNNYFGIAKVLSR